MYNIIILIIIIMLIINIMLIIIIMLIIFIMVMIKNFVIHTAVVRNIFWNFRW